MYRCDLCGACSAPGESSIRITASTRSHNHPKRTKTLIRPDGRRKTCVIDEGGTGTQIVRELVVCPACAIAARVRERPVSKAA